MRTSALAITLAIAVTALFMLGIKALSQTTAAPYHIEWDEYPVGGMVLCTPPADTVRVKCALLPPGAYLMIPHVVEGEEPEKKRSKT